MVIFKLNKKKGEAASPKNFLKTKNGFWKRRDVKTPQAVSLPCLHSHFEQATL